MKDKVIALVEELLQVPAGTINEDTQIADVEQWDSLAHVMIIGALEERLGIAIDLDVAVEISSMKELLEKVEEKA